MKNFAFSSLFSILFISTTSHSVSFDDPRAESVFKTGCENKDYYACARLGQFYEVKEKDLKKALPIYEESCAGKDHYGCLWTYEAVMTLCYDKGEKAFCGRQEPKGEYRMIAFLETLNDKYLDVFKESSVSFNFRMEKTQGLYDKRLKERSKQLLKALKLAIASDADGAVAEWIGEDIRMLEGKARLREP